MWNQITCTYLQLHTSVLVNICSLNMSTCSRESSANWIETSIVCLSFFLKHDKLTILAESLYDVKYWTSIITSNVRQINFSNENIKNKHWCFQISKIVSQKSHFGILIYILSWKHLFEIYFRLLRRNNKLKTTIFWQTFDVIIAHWTYLLQILSKLCF